MRKVPPVAKRLSASGILGIAFAALIIGHLLLKEYMPGAAFGVLAFLLLFLLLGYVLLRRNDAFGFVMIIYCCSHFSYADNQGGLWNLMAFGLITMHLAMGRPSERGIHRDPLVAVLLSLLVVFNVCGWILRNPVDYIERAQGAAAFLGFIAVFYVMSNVTVTPARFRAFLIVTLVMFVYQLLVALNQRHAIFNINTPMLGAYGKGIGFITYGSTNAQGTLRHSELFGEYGLLFWCLLIPLLCSSAAQRELRIGSTRVAAILLLGLSFIFVTSTRSAALLAAAAAVGYLAALKVMPFRSIDRFGRQVQLGMALAVLIPLVGTYIGVGSLGKDMGELGNSKFSTESILSGEAINRAPLFEFGIRRLSGESWIIGYGCSTPRANQWAWTGRDPLRSAESIADLHSLYLALPMLYGWAGSAAFLWLVVLAVWRSGRASLRYRNQMTFLVPIAIGFTVMWVAFLGDQFKISALRNPNYHMMFWVWLGMTMAVVRTLTDLSIESRHLSKGVGPLSLQALAPPPVQLPPRHLTRQVAARQL